MTRARLDLALSWAWRASPGGRGSRKPSRFLDPAAPAGCAHRRSRAKRQGRGRMCRECGKPLQTPARQGAPPVRRLPGALRRGAVRAAPRSGAPTRADEEEIAAFMVFSNATLELIASQAGRSPRSALLEVSGVGQEKLERTARSSSSSSAEPRDTWQQIWQKICREIPTKIICPLPGSAGTLLGPTAFAHHGPDKPGARGNEGGGPDDHQHHPDARLRSRPASACPFAATASGMSLGCRRHARSAALARPSCADRPRADMGLAAYRPGDQCLESTVQLRSTDRQPPGRGTRKGSAAFLFLQTSQVHQTR